MSRLDICVTVLLVLSTVLCVEQLDCEGEVRLSTSMAWHRIASTHEQVNRYISDYKKQRGIILHLELLAPLPFPFPPAHEDTLFASSTSSPLTT